MDDVKAFHQPQSDSRFLTSFSGIYGHREKPPSLIVKTMITNTTTYIITPVFLPKIPKSNTVLEQAEASPKFVGACSDLDNEVTSSASSFTKKSSQKFELHVTWIRKMKTLKTLNVPF